MSTSVDDAEAILKAGGWSCGDMLCRTAAGKVLCLVLANRGEHRIVAKAETQAEAWTAAAEQASRLAEHRRIKKPRGSA